MRDLCSPDATVRNLINFTVCVLWYWQGKWSYPWWRTGTSDSVIEHVQILSITSMDVELTCILCCCIHTGDYGVVGIRC